MQDLFAVFSSLSWWISVVIVGILINIVSNLLQRGLDGSFSKSSARLQRYSERIRDKSNQDYERVRNSQHEQMLWAFREMRYRLRMLTYLVYGVICWLLGLLITDYMIAQYPFLLVAKFMLFLIGSIAMLVANGQAYRAIYHRRILTKVIAPIDSEDPKTEGNLALRIRRFLGISD